PVAGRPVLRGLCSASPGGGVSALPAGVPAPAGSTVDTAAILLSVVAGWSASQAVSALGDRRLHTDAAGAAAVMAAAGAAVVALSSGVAVGGWGPARPRPRGGIFFPRPVGHFRPPAPPLRAAPPGRVRCAPPPAVPAAA